MVEPHLRLSSAELRCRTPADWIAAVRNDFGAFLNDHASCEKKASGLALNVAAHYPDRPRVVLAMADLAVEELNHYREVVRLLCARGLPLAPDRKDGYVRSMNQLIRRGPMSYLLDRLLVAGIIEARGHERFGLLAREMHSPSEAGFYRAITASEARHAQLFVDLAVGECQTADVAARLDELLAAEAEIISRQPLRASLH